MPHFPHLLLTGLTVAAIALVPPLEAQLAPLRPLTFTVTEGTWMSVDVSPDGRRLAFDLLGQIFTVPIEGGPARQLTAGPAFAERPTFSRDGRFLLFRSDRSGTPALWRVAVDGGAPIPVESADTASLHPAKRRRPMARDVVRPPDTLWAPGHHYGVRLPPAVKAASSVCWTDDLEVLEGSTGRSRRIPRPPDCGDDAYGALPQSLPGSAFTPDGRAFITAYGGHLQRIDLATATARVIPFTATVTLQIRPLVRFPHRIAEDSLVRARRIEQPRVSPDGRRVVFTAFDRLWLVPLSLTGQPAAPPRRLTTFDVRESEPVWSPDGRSIAFVTRADDGEDGAIYRVRADGEGAPVRLTRDTASYGRLTYTADGQHLVAVRQPEMRGAMPSKEDTSSRSHLAWFAAAGGEMTIVPIPEGCNAVPLAAIPNRADAVQVAAGGQVIAVSLVRRSVSSATDTMPARLLEVQRGSCPLLSPTGDRALLRGNEYGTYVLLEVPRGSDTTVPKVAGDGSTLAQRRIVADFPSWAPDGRSFTYAFGRVLYRYDLARADALVRDSVARAGTARAVVGPAYRPDSIVFDVALPRDRPRGTLVFRHARLITMRGDTVIERGDLVVRNRRIVAMGPSGTVAIPLGAQVIEATGQTIMPGLVDLHNHILGSFVSGDRRTLIRHYKLNLALGVLTSRDPQAMSLDFLTYEDQVAAGLLLGPRLRTTGPGIGGMFGGPSIESFAEARALVDRYADVYRVGYLKEYQLPRREVRQWLVMAAAERGLNVVSHGTGTSHLVQNAIDGYGGFDHRLYVWPLYADVRQLLARTGMTLGHHEGGGASFSLPVGHFTRLLDSTALQRLRDWQIQSSGALRDSSQEHALLASHRRADSAIAQLAAAGVHVAVSNHGEIPGYGTHMYTWALVEGGMPALEALRSATLRGAEALGLDQNLGSLAVGKLADVLVLTGNPLEKIHHTMSIESVLFNGRWYDAATLDERWPRPGFRAPAGRPAQKSP